MFTSSLVIEMQMFVYLSLGTQKKKKNQHFWVTVVVLLQNEKPNCLYFVSFPDGRVSTAVKQKQNQPPKTEGNGLHQCV